MPDQPCSHTSTSASTDLAGAQTGKDANGIVVLYTAGDLAALARIRTPRAARRA
jgi:hypothetical protein